MKINTDALALSKVSRFAHPTIATIRAAMMAGVPIEFDYDGKHRVVEAHAIGTSTKDGGLLLRSYQVDGDSSRPLPQWALFRIEGIKNLNATLGKSLAPREGYSEGDRQMRDVIIELDV